MPTLCQPAASASAANTDESTPPDMATATRRPAKGANTSRALAGSASRSRGKAAGMFMGSGGAMGMRPVVVKGRAR